MPQSEKEKKVYKGECWMGSRRKKIQCVNLDTLDMKGVKEEILMIEQIFVGKGSREEKKSADSRFLVW